MEYNNMLTVPRQFARDCILHLIGRTDLKDVNIGEYNTNILGTANII
jgi:hypothetical protein